jgi:hypothetical protein
MSRLASTPTSSSANHHRPVGKEQERARRREQHEQKARSAAIEKEARKKAQLWRALESRSITRLQAAFRGIYDRKRVRTLEEAMPDGWRAAVREAWKVERAQEMLRREDLRRKQSLAEKFRREAQAKADHKRAKVAEERARAVAVIDAKARLAGKGSQWSEVPPVSAELQLLGRTDREASLSVGLDLPLIMLRLSVRPTSTGPSSRLPHEPLSQAEAGGPEEEEEEENAPRRDTHHEAVEAVSSSSSSSSRLAQELEPSAATASCATEAATGDELESGQAPGPAGLKRAKTAPLPIRPTGASDEHVSGAGSGRAERGRASERDGASDGAGSPMMKRVVTLDAPASKTSSGAPFIPPEEEGKDDCVSDPASATALEPVSLEGDAGGGGAVVDGAAEAGD